ncbi:MAG: prephenate dehydrogenase [Streptosporangiales bacterium]
MSDTAPPKRLLVAGTGLVGTSVALAATATGIEVLLHDADEAHLSLATEMGAGSPYTDGEQVDLAVIAVPPHLVGEVLASWQRRGVATAYTDVASVKKRPRDDAMRLGCDLRTYVGSHPLAGRERSGPAAAAGDLFLGRPWAVCPTSDSAPEAVSSVTALAHAVGADPLLLSAEEHDRAVAAVSHAPHVLASALAAQLTDADTRLAGQGVRDVTRVADGDPGLWTSILAGNAAEVAEIVAATASDLDRLANALRAVSRGEARGESDVRDLLERGVAGRKALPGKHGGPTRTYAVVAVVLPDRPGQLAKLFHDADASGVNVEDVAIEHSPGALVGMVELSVRPDGRDALVTGLRAAGWSISR